MDKVKDKLHIGSKRKEDKAAALAGNTDQGTYHATAIHSPFPLRQSKLLYCDYLYRLSSTSGKAL